MHRLRDQQLVLGGACDVGLRDQRRAGGGGGAEKFSPVHDNLLLVDDVYCRVPLRSTLSSHDTAAYMMMASVESTKTATQTSAIS